MLFSDRSTLSLIGLNGYKFISEQNSKQNWTNILKADLRPHNFIFGKTKKRFNGLLIDLNPRIKIRILRNQASAPVRTPSTMASFRFHFIPPKWNLDNNQRSFFASYTHSSNGQDGPALSEEILADGFTDKDTVKIQKVNKNKYFNVYNGNFATNFLELGYNTFFTKKYNKGDKEFKFLSWRKQTFLNLYEGIPKQYKFKTEYNLRYGLNIHSKVFGIDPENVVFGYEPDLVGYFSFFKICI